MANFNIMQQIPDECFEPITIGTFEVALFDVEPFDSGFRWIYRVDGTTDLSNFVLNIDEDCLPIGQCFISDFFTGDVTEDVLASLEPYGNCLQDEPFAECEVFSPDKPCTVEAGERGFKFDDLPDGLAGQSQLFAFIINQPATAEFGCVALTTAGVTACGTICLPSCVACENPCDCDEEENTFDVTVTLPSDCFTFTGTGEGGIPVPADVRFGYCIGAVNDVGPVECQAPAEVFVCEQTIVCCCTVNIWTRTVDLDIQFNVPKTADCLSDNIGEGEFLYECVNDTPTVTQVCITCEDELTSPFVPAEELDCTNVTVTINSVTDNGDGTATINYTVNLPDCVVVDNGDDIPGTPAQPVCPPLAPTVQKTQTNARPVNRTLRRGR